MFKKLVLFITILALTISTGCGRMQAYQKTGFYLYNIFDVTIRVSSKTNSIKADEILTKSLDSLRDLDNRINPLNPISDINAINDNAAKRPVKVGPDVFSMIEKAMKGSELTNGAFDLTSAPLIDLYKNNRQPSLAAIKYALTKINYLKLNLDPPYQTIRFADPKAELTFDLIKKGYALDLVAKNLNKYYVSSALIRSNNTLYALGSKKAWPIIIFDPDDPEKKLAKFSIKNKGFSRVTLEQNNFYANAKTWLPLLRENLEITDAQVPVYVGVLAPNAVTAEVLAHALFILGPEKGLGLIKRLKYDAVYLMRGEDGALYAVATNGLKSKIKDIPVN